MNSVSTLGKLKKPLQELADFAISLGWQVSRTRGGHIRFTKPGYPPIYTSSTPSDPRAALNARALLRRAKCRQARRALS
ncbi:type II toxin-antitoxin system HicA family toxin [Halopseudomonas xiamenensis]|uniref:type II toxin-antitoxin system HicA family toxin n=1 Tax=Halopseudomonas xiamenensis TaxID=157792 RepID=UPI001626FE82|nr:type II toxin-antitoxin system HicA family toxin [Halopseudomonas xiamenensis]